MSPDVEVRHAGTQDVAALEALDTSYSTDRVYAVEQSGLAFRLIEQRRTTPFVKRYAFAPADATHVALLEDELVGAAGIALEAWNRRMRLEHLYVAPASRGRGVGTALLEAAVAAAGAAGARVLWCETQNMNTKAIDFYLRHGFALAGLDTSLYDDTTGEVAVFLARDV